MSPNLRYLPGPWIALVRSGHAVLLPESAPASEVDRLWNALSAEPTVETLLSAVLAERGLSLTGMAPFGIVCLDEDLHAILRGHVSLGAEGHELSSHVTGLGVTTWNERRFSGQERVTIAVDEPGARPQDDGGAWLPLHEGAVRFGRLEADLPSACDGQPIEPLSAPVPVVASEQSAASVPAVVSVQPAASVPLGTGPEEPQPDAEELAPEPEPDAEELESQPVPDAEELESQPVPDAVELESQPVPDAEELAPEPESVAEKPQPDPGTEDSEPEPEPEPKPATESEAEAVPGQPAAASEDTTAFHEDTTAFHEETSFPADDALAGLGDTIVTAEDAEDEDTILSPSARAATAAASNDPSQQTPRPAGSTDQAQPRQYDAEAIIDSVPWLAAAREAALAGNQAPASPLTDNRTPASSLTEPPAPVAALGDHDGNTVLRGDLPEVPQPVAPRAPSSSSPGTGPLVLARVCAAGHANPPINRTCGACGADLPAEPVEARRPALGRIVLSNGESVPLDRSAVVGRQPSISRSASGSMPRVLQVASPSGDISRSHLEVRIDGWHVQLVDLNATNGTVLVREGQTPRRLGKGEAVLLLDGDIADLGDGVALRFEGLL